MLTVRFRMRGHLGSNGSTLARNVASETPSVSINTGCLSTNARRLRANARRLSTKTERLLTSADRLSTNLQCFAQTPAECPQMPGFCGQMPGVCQHRPRVFAHCRDFARLYPARDGDPPRECLAAGKFSKNLQQTLKFSRGHSHRYCGASAHINNMKQEVENYGMDQD